MRKNLAVGVIPARYGSTRFPGKALALIAGKSLLQRTFESVKKCPDLDAIYILTDDSRIYDHARGFGANVFMTSPECINGTERIVDAIENYPALASYDIYVNIQGDEPCIPSTSISQVIQILKQHTNDLMATAIIPIESIEELFSLGVVKCVKSEQGYALYFSRSPIPWHKDPHAFSQEEIRKRYHRHIGIYAYRKELLLKYTSLLDTPLRKMEDLEQLKILEHGYPIRVVEVEEHSISVDYPEDVQKVEQWLCTQNLSL